MKTSLIALHGATGSGKDAVADYLVSNHGFTKIAFADRLKWEICDAFNCPPELFSDRELKEQVTEKLNLEKCTNPDFVEWTKRRVPSHFDWTPREIMQTWGDFRRFRNANYFSEALTKAVLNMYMEAIAEGGDFKVVVCDVRYPNEQMNLRNGLSKALHLQPDEFEVWNILRPNNPYVTPHKHSSNNPLPPSMITRTLRNETTLTALQYLVDDYLNAPRKAGAPLDNS